MRALRTRDLRQVKNVLDVESKTRKLRIECERLIVSVRYYGHR